MKGTVTTENPHDIHAVDRRGQPPGNQSAVYVAAVIVLSLSGVGGIILLNVWQPEKDHTATITLILGFLVPIVTALLAGAVAQVQKSVNGRLTQLLAMTARTHAAEGELRAKKEITQAAPTVVVNTPATSGAHQHSRAGDVRPTLAPPPQPNEGRR